MNWTFFYTGQEDYLVNLIDSPGHVDFSSEVRPVKSFLTVYLHNACWLVCMQCMYPSSHFVYTCLHECLCTCAQPIGFNCCSFVWWGHCSGGRSGGSVPSSMLIFSVGISTNSCIYLPFARLLLLSFLLSLSSPLSLSPPLSSPLSPLSPHLLSSFSFSLSSLLSSTFRLRLFSSKRG